MKMSFGKGAGFGVKSKGKREKSLKCNGTSLQMLTRAYIGSHAYFAGDVERVEHKLRSNRPGWGRPFGVFASSVTFGLEH